MTSPTPAEIKAGHKLFVDGWEFMKGVVAMDGLPPSDLPEIAFAGRSNVGKSSLINALTGRRNLARSSNTPGRTQEINFFASQHDFRIVDLPGYGYAKASRKDVNAWNRLIRDYLRGRPNLRRVCLLIDARHGVKKNDAEIMKMLDDSAVSYQVVLTKSDKIKKTEISGVVEKTEEVLRKHVAAFPVVQPTSTLKNTGLEELRASLVPIL